LSCGEELGVSCVEVEEVLGDPLALGFVGAEDRLGGETGFDVVDLPREVLGVEEGGIHALTCFGLKRVVSVDE